MLPDAGHGREREQRLHQPQRPADLLNRRRTARLLAVVAAVVLGGCGDRGPGAEAAIDVETVFAPPGATLVDVDAAERRFAERVAACMRDAGFHYEVHAARSPRFEGRGEAVSLSMPTDGSDWVDHARRYGYGYVANQRLLDIDQAARVAWAERHPDPNERHVASLSPSEREAWYTALYGERADGTEGVTDHPWPPADPTAGCHGDAVVAQDPLVVASEELRRELAEIDQRVEVDPDVTAAEAAWSACMAARGHRAGRATDFRFQVQTEVLAVLERAGTVGEETVEVDVGGEAFEVTVPRRDPAALQEALAREVEAAVDDAECDRSSRLGATRQAVRDRLRAAFVEEHGAAIASLVAGAG